MTDKYYNTDSESDYDDNTDYEDYIEEELEYEKLQEAYLSMKEYTDNNYLPLCENISIHSLGEFLFEIVNS